MGHEERPVAETVQPKTFPAEMLLYAGIVALLFGYSIVVETLTKSTVLQGIFVGILGVAFLFGGLLTRGLAHPSSNRVTDVLWGISALLVGAALLMVTTEVSFDNPAIGAVSMALATAYAAVLWWFRKRTLLLLPFFGLAAAFVLSITPLLFLIAPQSIAPQSVLLPWLGVLALSLTWMFLGMMGTLMPRRPAIAIGAVGTVLTPAILQAPLAPGAPAYGAAPESAWPSIVLGFASVVLLFFIGARESHTGVVGLGFAGLAIYVGILVGEIGASLFLGVVLVAVGVVLFLGVTAVTAGAGPSNTAAPSLTGTPPEPPAEPPET